MKRSNSNLIRTSVKNYCQHFQAMEQVKVPPIKKMVCCVCKAEPPNTWICLSKGCGTVLCGSNKFKHVNQHLDETSTKHCLFINSASTQIRCMLCRMEILDFHQLDQQEFQQVKNKLDPVFVRQRFSKKDVDNPLFKNGGNLQNSAAHKKTAQGLCGLLSRKTQSAVTAVIQFFSNIGFIRDVFETLEVATTNDQCRLLSELITLVRKIWSGDVRILTIQSFQSTVISCLNSYKGYSKKDPFQLFILILNLVHEEVKYTYHIPLGGKEPESVPDQWEMLSGQNYEHSPLKSNLCGNILFKMKCPQCELTKDIQGDTYKIQLQFPKIRRQSKVLQADFERHKFESPIKNRRRSLVDRLLSRDAQIPISLVQLMINYVKTKLPSNRNLIVCQKCKTQMTPILNQFSKLPNLMLVIIHHHPLDPTHIGGRPDVEFPLDQLDMKGFVQQAYQGQTVYNFESAICQRDNQFLTLSKTNSKHVYEYLNQYVKLTTETSPPYMLCYSLRNNYATLYRNIMSNVEAQINPEYQLPDLWIQQLKHFQPYALANPQVCKHSKLKLVSSRLNKQYHLPRQIYMALVDKFGGRVYSSQLCKNCQSELHAVNLRRRNEKEFISKLDSYRCKIYCMISSVWLNKWTQYLYKKPEEKFIVKGYPDPGPITNSSLLDGNRCKPDLKKGDDFKLVSFYVWSFFKELYGGGPEIQYKTRAEDKSKLRQYCDQEVLKEIRQRVEQLQEIVKEEYYLTREWPGSPLKRRESKQTQFEGLTTPNKQ